MQLLLTLGANSNMKDSKGNTALHWALHQGNHTAVTLLLKNNCSVVIKNEQVSAALKFETKKKLKLKLLNDSFLYF